VTHARSAATTRAPLEMAFDLERVRQVLVGRGFHEAITYSFVSPEQQGLIDPELAPLALANPLSAELSVMRTSLWPGLLQAARQNLSRQQSRVRLFESGLRFRVETDGFAAAGDAGRDSASGR
jgi:phenylalanyl-tRNA synthetase beta chain